MSPRILSFGDGRALALAAGRTFAGVDIGNGTGVAEARDFGTAGAFWASR
jgi:hypothetical protein